MKDNLSFAQDVSIFHTDRLAEIGEVQI